LLAHPSRAQLPDLFLYVTEQPDGEAEPKRQFFARFTAEQIANRGAKFAPKWVTLTPCVPLSAPRPALRTAPPLRHHRECHHVLALTTSHALCRCAWRGSCVPSGEAPKPKTMLPPALLVSLAVEQKGAVSAAADGADGADGAGLGLQPLSAAKKVAAAAGTAAAGAVVAAGTAAAGAAGGLQKRVSALSKTTKNLFTGQSSSGLNTAVAPRETTSRETLPAVSGAVEWAPTLDEMPARTELTACRPRSGSNP
jgi:hypothetical protein